MLAVFIDEARKLEGAGIVVSPIEREAVEISGYDSDDDIIEELKDELDDAEKYNGEDSDDDKEYNPDRQTQRPPDTELPAIERACLKFYISILDHDTSRSDFNSVLISGLTALGVNAHGGFQAASDFTPVLSAVIKLARIMVVEHGFQQADDNPSKPIYDSVQRLIVFDSPTPMDWIFDILTYGFVVHYTTTAVGHVRWEEHKLFFKTGSFTMDDFTRWMHKLAKECRRMLIEDLLMTTERGLPRFDWKSIQDDALNTERGYSFVSDRRNQFPDNDDWLATKVLSEPEIGRQFFAQSMPASEYVMTKIKRTGAEKYQGRVSQFTEKLAVLVHLTGGQPARIPELLSIRYCNTVSGGQRNVFVHNGKVRLVRRYHKGYKHSGQVKEISRFLPREVGEIFIYYLWLVVPFVDDIWTVVEQKQRTGGFIWKATPDGGRWRSMRFRQAIKREALIEIGVEGFTSAVCRHCVIAIADR